ncbi:Major Facilitator Superfamily protein [compost metagenome]
MNTHENKAFSFALLAAIWACALGNVGGFVAPEIVFNLMGNRELSESAAGSMVALELLGLALGSLGLSLAADRLPVRMLALLGAGLMVITQYLSSTAQDPLYLMMLRFVCGLAQGLLFGLANAVLANGPNPHARLAAANIVTVIVGSLLLYILAPLQKAWSELSLFTILALICLVLTPFCLGLQSRLVQHHQAPRSLGLPNAASYWLVLAIAIFSCGSGSAFTFSFLMGSGAGLEDGSINTVVSIAILAAIPGSLLCGVLGHRVHPLLPLLLSLAIHGLASVSAANAGGMWSFSLGIAGILFGVYFLLPYMQALSTRYDPLGATSAAIGGSFFLTMAGGAYVGGALVEVAGLPALGWLVVVCNLLTGLLVAIAVLGSKAKAMAASYA